MFVMSEAFTTEPSRLYLPIVPIPSTPLKIVLNT